MNGSMQNYQNTSYHSNMTALPAANYGIYSVTDSASMYGHPDYDFNGLRKKLFELRDENSGLVKRNHALQGELEEKCFSLHRLTVELDEFKNKEQEFLVALARLQSSANSSAEKCHEALVRCDALTREANDAATKVDKAKAELNEAQSQLETNNAAMQSVRCELDDTKKTLRRTEADRNLALESAERLQSAYEDYQFKISHQVAGLESKLSAMKSERDELLLRVENCDEKLNELRQQNESNLSSERAESKRNVSELKLQINRLTLRSNALEAELASFEATKKDLNSARKEVSELRKVNDQQKAKMLRYHIELKEVRNQLTSLETVASVVQLSRLNKNTVNKRSVRSSTDVNRPLSDNKLEVANLKTGSSNADDRRVVRQKSGLSSIEKSDLTRDSNEDGGDLQLTSKSTIPPKYLESSTADDELDDDDALVNQGALELEATLTHLEFERTRLQAKITELSKALSEQQLSKATLEAMLSHQAARIVDLEREAGEQTDKGAVVEREARKRAMQLAKTEKQLKEVLVESATKAEQLKAMEEKLQKLTAEYKESSNNLDVKTREVVELNSAINLQKQQNSERCRELEAKIVISEQHIAAGKYRTDQLESNVASLQKELAQSQAKGSALQDSLTEALRAAEKVKVDHSEATMTHKQTLNELTSRAENAELVSRFNEEELSESRAENKRLMAELSSKSNALRELESRMNSLVGDVKEKAAKLEEKNRDMANRDAVLRESNVRIEELELEENRMEMEIGRLKKELEGAVETLEKSRRKMAALEMEIKNKNEELARAENQIEMVKEEAIKSKAEYEDQIEACHKQLKKERDEASTEMEKLNSEVNRLNLSIAEKNSEIEAKIKREQELSSDLKHSIETIASKDQKISTLEQDFYRKSKSISDEKQKSNSLLNELEMISKELKRKEQENEAKQFRMKELEQESRTYRKEIEKMSADIFVLNSTLQQKSDESNERCSELESVLRLTRGELEGRGAKIAELEQYAQELISNVQASTLELRRRDALEQSLRAELEQARSRVEQMRTETSIVAGANERASDQLKTSREHLQKLQLELSTVRKELSSTQMEQDRLAQDVHEAAELLQTKDEELTRLVQSIENLADERDKLETTLRKTEKESLQIKKRHCRELAALKECHESVLIAREQECTLLKAHLESADMRQRHLVNELQRASQQLHSKDGDSLKASHPVLPVLETTPQFTSDSIISKNVTVNKNLCTTDNSVVDKRDDRKNDFSYINCIKSEIPIEINDRLNRDQRNAAESKIVQLSDAEIQEEVNIENNSSCYDSDASCVNDGKSLDPQNEDEISRTPTERLSNIPNSNVTLKNEISVSDSGRKSANMKSSSRPSSSSSRTSHSSASTVISKSASNKKPLNSKPNTNRISTESQPNSYSTRKQPSVKTSAASKYASGSNSLQNSAAFGMAEPIRNQQLNGTGLRRSGSTNAILDEKLRIQNRLKALIGYENS